jgi:predicted RND superfamily exporter protein
MSPERARTEPIPNDKLLVAQYLLLYSFSGPEDLNSLMDPAHRTGVVRAYVKSDEAEFGASLFQGLNEFIARRFHGLPVQARVAGGALGVQTALNEVVVHEKLVNVAQIAVLILLLSTLVLRSLVGGAMVITPLAFAVVVNLGLMGLTGTWLSVGTSTITAMAIGIGADFAIYLVFRIREELERDQCDIAGALRASLNTSGKGIFFVSSAVVFGYLLLGVSAFRLWRDLGILTAVMIAVSAVGTVTIIPAMVCLLRPRFLFRRADAEAIAPRDACADVAQRGETSTDDHSKLARK